MNTEGTAAPAETIAAGLRAAFPVRPIPSNHRREDGQVDWEVDEDLQRILGKTWPELKLEDWTHMVNPIFIRRGTNAEFFKYYVPSILTCVLHDIEWVDQLALSALLPDNQRREPREEWRVFRASFSPVQVKAIVAFLEWVRTTADPVSAEWHSADTCLHGLWQ